MLRSSLRFWKVSNSSWADNAACTRAWEDSVRTRLPGAVNRCVKRAKPSEKLLFFRRLDLSRCFQESPLPLLSDDTPGSTHTRWKQRNKQQNNNNNIIIGANQMVELKKRRTCPNNTTRRILSVTGEQMDFSDLLSTPYLELMKTLQNVAISAQPRTERQTRVRRERGH